MGLFSFFTARREWLTEWQHLVCEDKGQPLFLSRKELEELTVQTVAVSIKIFDDCSRLVNNTVKPSVFFSRLALAEEHLEKLAKLEPYMREVDQISLNEYPTALLRTFQKNKEQYICDFIYRYYWAVKEKAEHMKTDKGKQGQFQKFYESLEPYFDQISEHNMKYVNAMREQRI